MPACCFVIDHATIAGQCHWVRCRDGSRDLIVSAVNVAPPFFEQLVERGCPLYTDTLGNRLIHVPARLRVELLEDLMAQGWRLTPQS